MWIMSGYKQNETDISGFFLSLILIDSDSEVYSLVSKVK